MLGLRAQRITFGCPAGNIAGGYGINYGRNMQRFRQG